jgi:methyl-accepting chemotaxis protein
MGSRKREENVMSPNVTSKITVACLVFCSGMLMGSQADAQRSRAARAKAAEADAAGAAAVSRDRDARSAAPTDDEGEALTAQDQLMLRRAKEAAGKIAKTMEAWVREKKITREKLFSYLYYPIPDSDPPKFHTDYDHLSDAEFVQIQDPYLEDKAIRFVVTVDKNGYLPTHNKRYSKPLTGHKSIDLVANRTKRIFNDRTGIRAARNTDEFLLQGYKRDTGEVMKDLSVPIYVFDQHWGGIRFGYKSTE